MKKLLYILICAFLCNIGYAQLDRSIRPEAAKASSLNFGKYKVYTLDNGIKLIVVEDHKLPRLTVNLIIDRDPIFEGEKAGYVSLAGEMLRQGTTHRDKNTLDEEVDFMGAYLSTSSNSVYASGLSKYKENLFELLADVTLNPAFPQEEFEKLKKQTLSGIESSKDSPDALASIVFNANLYGKNHPYGESETKTTVEGLTVEDCKTYYNNYWMPNAAYIAVVGDIKAKEARKLVEQYLGDWEMKNKPSNTYEAPAVPQGTQVGFVNKESAVQSVVTIGNTITLPPGHPDVVKLQLANQILGVGSLGRLFQNIREDKGYTYGAYSDYETDKLIGEFTASASVRNEVTDSAITEFIAEFKRIQNTEVTDIELEGAKNYIMGSFGRALEKPQTMANFALNIERYGLPKDYYQTYLEKLQSLTKADVMAAAKKYINTDNLQITVVGKASEVAEKLEKFGDFQYYDEEGNKTGKPSLPLPEGVTATSVLSNYIKALGGEENLKKVKDVRTTMDVEIAGAPATFNAVVLQKAPNLFKMTLTAGAMGTLMQQSYDGEKAMMTSPQGSQELEGDDKKDMELQSMLNKELLYDELGYEMELTKMVMVDNKKAYVLELTNPMGKKETQYFDADSHLLIKAESSEEGPQGAAVTSTETFADYKEVNGVMYPHTMVNSVGPQKISRTVTEILVNKGIDKSEFSIK